MLEKGEKEGENNFNHPTLCPDEVYAIYIQPQLLTGEYVEAYPLIGRPALPGERAILTDSALQAMGLRDGSGNGIEADTYRRFHIENTANIN